MTNIANWKMTIEIVDFPIKMVIFHSYVSHYLRVVHTSIPCRCLSAVHFDHPQHVNPETTLLPGVAHLCKDAQWIIALPNLPSGNDQHSYGKPKENQRKTIGK